MTSTLYSISVTQKLEYVTKQTVPEPSNGRKKTPLLVKLEPAFEVFALEQTIQCTHV